MGKLYQTGPEFLLKKKKVTLIGLKTSRIDQIVGQVGSIKTCSKLLYVKYIILKLSLILRKKMSCPLLWVRLNIAYFAEN